MMTDHSTRPGADRIATSGAMPPTTILVDPDDVITHPGISLDDKRARLASWASDSRAVEGQPGLRRLDSGAVIRLDGILAALQNLDDAPPAGASVSPGPVATIFGRSRRRWPTRLAWRRRRDDDDDPPPSPATIAPPPLLQVAA